ncbi:sensor histidine kinase [Curtobacterium sp. RRHDQ10]|uniref:sensor histidine kinase n=1 Tax=Curtobacterium phyllosphaerae TaxID=3413379 RepID=UPI003BEF7ECF
MTPPGRRRVLPPSLTGRIVLTTVAVAVVAVLAVSIAGFQLVRQESLQQTGLVLRASAEVVAASSPDDRARLAARLERRSGGRIDIGFGGTGGVSALAAPLPRRLANRLATEDRVSARDVTGLRTVLVEAVPARGGGSVIAVEDVSILHGDRVLDRFAIALLIGVFVAIGLGIVLARFTTRPLRAIASTATRLAHGDRGLTAPRPDTGDIRDTGDIGAADAPAAREIAEIQRALQVLDTELARSEGAQREFLLSISHEFRTPLAALRGYADALADGLVAAPDVPHVAGVMRAETERLDAFVGDLLALARLEADDFAIRREPFDVVALVDQAVTAWGGRAATIDVSVRRESAPGSVRIVSDPLRVRQLVDGLIENALRVSPSGGVVRIHVLAAPDHVAVSVIDTGPGLDAGDLQQVFVRGALRDRHSGDRPVGTGLGLSIAARLTERLGGVIEPVARPAGAEFRVTLPRESS